MHQRARGMVEPGASVQVRGVPLDVQTLFDFVAKDETSSKGPHISVQIGLKGARARWVTRLRSLR